MHINCHQYDQTSPIKSVWKYIHKVQKKVSNSKDPVKFSVSIKLHIAHKGRERKGLPRPIESAIRAGARPSNYPALICIFTIKHALKCRQRRDRKEQEREVGCRKCLVTRSAKFSSSVAPAQSSKRMVLLSASRNDVD